MVEVLGRSRDVERRPTNIDPAGGECIEVFRLIIFGSPTGGSITLPVRVLRNVPGETVINNTTNVVIDFDSGPSEVAASLSLHPNIGINDVIAGSAGGTLPHQEVWFRFVGSRKMSEVTIGNAIDQDLTGGFTPYSLIRR